MTATIESIKAFEILDSRGKPTIQVAIELNTGTRATAAVPSGASTGEQEAVELRDGDKKRYAGLGVQKAVHNVNDLIAPKLIGKNIFDQCAIDQQMIALDGTANKAHLGANAILGVSMAVARAASVELDLPLYRYLGGVDATIMPVPMLNVLNGGKHADNNVDFQEYMIMPIGASSFSEALQWSAETFYALKSVLHQKGLSTAVGDEGGFAPDLKSNTEPLDLILQAIEAAGFKAGTQIGIALDPAASELYKDGRYVFGKSDGSSKTAEEMIALFDNWLRNYPIISLEDGFAEFDSRGWKLATEALGHRVQLVGDDNFVTNAKIIEAAIRDGIANSALIKLNQIGTVTETLRAIETARKGGYTCVCSHRSGETEDTFLADFTVATGVGQIKTGSISRSERVAKYNRLLAIERELGAAARFLGKAVLSKKAKEHAGVA